MRLALDLMCFCGICFLGCWGQWCSEVQRRQTWSLSVFLLFVSLRLFLLLLFFCSEGFSGRGVSALFVLADSVKV